MPKSPVRPQNLGKRVHADEYKESNPLKNKKAKLHESDVPVEQAFKLISQLTKLEKKVDDSKIEFQKFKETIIEQQELKNAKFESEIKKIKEIIDQQIIENLGNSLEPKPAQTEEIGTQINAGKKEENEPMVEDDGSKTDIVDPIWPGKDPKEMKPKSKSGDALKFDQTKLPKQIQKLLTNTVKNSSANIGEKNEMFQTPPDSKKKQFKVKAKASSISPPGGQEVDRHQILKDLRANGKKFKTFSDEQLLYITDPDVLTSLSHQTQPQKIEIFLKNPIFKEFKGKLMQPVLCLIFQTFGITNSKKIKGDDSEKKQKPQIKSLVNTNTDSTQKPTSKGQGQMDKFLEVTSLDSQQNRIHKDLEEKLASNKGNSKKF